MTNCVHDWGRPGCQLHLAVVADEWQGATTAIARCSGCGASSLLQLLAWQGKNLANRVYLLSPIPARVTDVFLRNIRSSYCDLSRHGHEFAALVAATERPAGLIATRLPDLLVLAMRAIPEGTRYPVPDWRELDGGTDIPELQALLDEIDRQLTPLSPAS
ncbi:MAG: hypothetical protein ACFHX7_00860 [Pseudomonadota bacterium]